MSRLPFLVALAALALIPACNCENASCKTDGDCASYGETHHCSAVCVGPGLSPAAPGDEIAACFCSKLAPRAKTRSPMKMRTVLPLVAPLLVATQAHAGVNLASGHLVTYSSDDTGGALVTAMLNAEAPGDCASTWDAETCCLDLLFVFSGTDYEDTCAPMAPPPYVSLDSGGNLVLTSSGHGWFFEPPTVRQPSASLTNTSADVGMLLNYYDPSADYSPPTPKWSIVTGIDETGWTILVGGPWTNPIQLTGVQPQESGGMCYSADSHGNVTGVYYDASAGAFYLRGLDSRN